MNQLEQQLDQFVNRKLSPPEFFNVLLESTVFVLSASNQADDFEAMAKVTDEENDPMLPIFSGADKHRDFTSETHKTFLDVPFRDLLAQIPEQYGVVINLHQEAIAIGPAGIGRMKMAGAGPLEVPGGLAKLFAEVDDEEDDDDDDEAEEDKPWWKFW